MIDHYTRTYGSNQQPKKRHFPILMPFFSILFIGAIILTTVFCSGFNFDPYYRNYTYNVAITRMPDGTQKVIKIKKWRDYDGEQVQIFATDGTIYLLSMHNTVLIRNPEAK